MGVRLAKLRHLPCVECRLATYANGHSHGLAEGADSGYMAAMEDGPHKPSDAVWLDDVRSVLVDAHRNAGHGGRWEVCTDVVCAELERWLHFETRPEAVQSRPAMAVAK